MLQKTILHIVKSALIETALIGDPVYYQLSALEKIAENESISEVITNIALVDTAAGGEETQPYLYVLTYSAEQTSYVTFSSMDLCLHRRKKSFWQYLCNPSILSKIL